LQRTTFRQCESEISFEKFLLGYTQATLSGIDEVPLNGELQIGFFLDYITSEVMGLILRKDSEGDALKKNEEMVLL